MVYPMLPLIKTFDLIWEESWDDVQKLLLFFRILDMLLNLLLLIHLIKMVLVNILISRLLKAFVHCLVVLVWIQSSDPMLLNITYGCTMLPSMDFNLLCLIHCALVQTRLEFASNFWVSNLCSSTLTSICQTS